MNGECNEILVKVWGFFLLFHASRLNLICTFKRPFAHFKTPKNLKKKKIVFSTHSDSQMASWPRLFQWFLATCWISHTPTKIQPSIQCFSKIFLFSKMVTHNQYLPALSTRAFSSLQKVKVLSHYDANYS